MPKKCERKRVCLCVATQARMRTCVCACVPACGACVRACVKERLRETGRDGSSLPQPTAHHEISQEDLVSGPALRLLCPWDFPDKNTGVHCHFLLQGIFLTQVRNPGLLHCKHILYHLSYKESPKYIYLAMPHGVRVLVS